MSQSIVYQGGHNWQYLGKFYGIDPTVLAAYNGQADVDVSANVQKGFKLKVPNAAELTAFYPEYRKIFLGSHESFGLALRPPTLTDAPQTLETFRSSHLVTTSGNMVIVNSARMRRFSHTGDNYAHGSALRSPNPNHEGAGAMGPDAAKLSFASTWWKCNVLVGDVLYGAGYDWPMSEFKRYLQPNDMLRMLTMSNLYSEPVWVAPRFAGGGKPKESVPYVPPTLKDLAGVKPGDVILLHGDEDEAGHSAIVTSEARVDEQGRVLVRVVDIYGEDWYDVSDHSVKAIIRPKKKLAAAPAQTVGGDPNAPQKVLDGGEAINDTAISDPLYPALL